jgi:hypothetical protein
MDIKTQIAENELFDTKEKLANWLNFNNSSRRSNHVPIENRKQIKEKHLPHLLKIIEEIDRRGFKTFKTRHLKGNVVKTSDREDRLPEYAFSMLACYLYKLVDSDVLKVRREYSDSRGTLYERNFETIEEALGDIYDRLE